MDQPVPLEQRQELDPRRVGERAVDGRAQRLTGQPVLRRRRQGAQHRSAASPRRAAERRLAGTAIVAALPREGQPRATGQASQRGARAVQMAAPNSMLACVQAAVAPWPLVPASSSASR